MRHIILCLLTLSCFAARAQRACGSHEYLQRLRDANPAVARGLDAAEAFQNTASRFNPATARMLSNGVIQIPVVVHVVYAAEAQNISDGQIKSQIDALNRDYRRANADSVNTPVRFRGLAADLQLEFVLATATPEGYPTNGIVRKAAAVTYWKQDDAVKFASAGGDAAWDSRYYLNIWVCPMRSSLLGYSSAPGGPSDRDGVVINTSVMGTFNVTAPFDRGRTAVHEVGHWLGLKHIWGDTYCGDDGIDDTPKQSNFTSGCPSGIRASCGNDATGDMYMNFMDYTSDACLNLFTKGQSLRVRSLFLAGGPRAAMLLTKGLDLPWSVRPEPVPEEAPAAIETAATIFPNPATSEVFVRFGGSSRAGQELRLYSLQGVLLKRVAVTGLQTRIDLSGLASGIYFVLAGSGSESVRLRFIKQ